jgi:hypothetical protein
LTDCALDVQMVEECERELSARRGGGAAQPGDLQSARVSLSGEFHFVASKTVMPYILSVLK